MLKNKPEVWISDLTHTAQGISAATFPLGASYVYTYTKELLGEYIDLKLFKFPNDLNLHLKQKFPAILSFSNYSWNFEISYKFAQQAKKINPNLIIIFGGPNFPTVEDEKIEFLKKRPAIDFYIELEGESGFVDLCKTIIDFNFDIKKIKTTKVKIVNTCYLAENNFIYGPLERIKNVNMIPSPYLSGSLDRFFSLPLVPMLETTRGCPFACTFCADGLATKNKVTRHDSDRIKEELHYIAKRVNNIEELILTDLNFAMYKQDLVTAQAIAETQKIYNFPTLIGASPGKNQPKRVLEVSTIIKGWNMGAAVQSTDPDVLKAIKRSNLSIDAYKELITQANSDGTKTESAVILAMPGDSKEKHLNSIRFCLDNKVSTIRTFQAMMLVGTEMESKQARKDYGLKTKFRTIPGTLGIYDIIGEKKPVAEIEEIIVANNTLSEQDYLDCRRLNLFVVTFYNNSIFEEIFSMIDYLDISSFDLIHYMSEHEELYTDRIKEIMKDFIIETKEDLYDSWDEANRVVLSPDILAKYIGGDMGTNELLMNKARLFDNFEDSCLLIVTSLKKILEEKNKLTNKITNYLDELHKFLLLRKNKVLVNIDSKHKDKFKYDFNEIKKENFKVNPENLLVSDHPLEYEFFHDENQKRKITNQLKLYAGHAVGIGKLLQQTDVRILFRNFKSLSLRD